MADDMSFSNEPKAPKKPKAKKAVKPKAAQAAAPNPVVPEPAPVQPNPAPVFSSSTGDVQAGVPPMPGEAPEPNFFAQWFSNLPFFIAIPALPIGAIIYGIRELARASKGKASNKVAGAVSLGAGSFVVLGIIASIVFVASIPGSSTGVLDVTVGDCVTDSNISFDENDGGEVEHVRVIDCDVSHYGQAYFVGTLSVTSWPGQAEVYVLAEDVCWNESVRVIAPDSAPELYMFYLAPTRESWDFGDREFVCYVGTDDPAGITGSLLGGN